MKIGVVGAGIFGIAAAIELSARGYDVTVFDQGAVPYRNATSTDVSKGIRRTWYAGDNETYVELVERAAVKWREWEKEFDGPIYHTTGGFSIQNSFEPGTPMYESWRYLKGRGAEIEVMSAARARERFPQFIVNDGETVVRDSWAGYLESGRAVDNLARLARGIGVEVRECTPVASVAETGQGAQIAVDGGVEEFDRVIVAAGVWVGRLLPEVGANVQVTHQEMVLIEVEDRDLFTAPRMPIWGVDPDGDGWYGFPLLREGYVKVAKEPLGDVVDPDSDRGGTVEFQEETLEFLRGRIPQMASGRVVDGRTCLYASTPDDHFVIDWAPGHQRVLVAGGGSGHGFKFGGSIGPIIADALEEKDNSLGRLFRIGDRFDTGRLATEESRGFARPSSPR